MADSNVPTSPPSKRRKHVASEPAGHGEKPPSADDKNGGDAGVAAKSRCPSIGGGGSPTAAATAAAGETVAREASPGEKSSKRKRRQDDVVDNDEDLKKLPLAPTLDEYLNGGHRRYAPRPEWYRLPGPGDGGLCPNLRATRASIAAAAAADAAGLLARIRNDVAGGGAPPAMAIHPDEIDGDVDGAAGALRRGRRANRMIQLGAVAGRRLQNLGGQHQQFHHQQQQQQQRVGRPDRRRVEIGGAPPAAAGMEAAAPGPLALEPDVGLHQFPPLPVPRRPGELLLPLPPVPGERPPTGEGIARGGSPVLDAPVPPAGGDATLPEGPVASDASSPPLRSSTVGQAAVFGFDCDSALHLAIKSGATEAALELVGAGACINFPNAKGITPLMIASQEGSLEVVRALLERGALPNATTIRGSTALIQACHFGKLAVAIELLRHGALVDQANLKNTTALMRASQEGHQDVVRLLLARNAGVNRRNDERMTALMLSSQRGHAHIVCLLVRAGAQVDAKTAQDSTSLMLACKRKHLDVARILVASGTELKLRDCKGRTVHETASRRGNTEFAEILTDKAQVALMKEDSRRERNLVMVRAWRLLQTERASLRLGGAEMTIHDVAENMGALALRHVCPSKQALVRAMTLPAPLIELISSFIPLPLIWEKQLMLLTSRSHIDPDSAVFNALDLIDEVLEVGGILQAFDLAGVAPPTSFHSWSAFQRWCGKCDVILSRCAEVDVAGIFARENGTVMKIAESSGASPDDLRRVEPAQAQRRGQGYLGVLARAPQSLTTTLSSHPYDMPSALFEKLAACHDMQSLVRRIGGVHFETFVANELVVMARMAVMWCESRPTY